MLTDTVLGHYHIEAHLGDGRYTDVYRAIDTVRKRTVALKVLKANLSGEEQSLSQYLQHAQGAIDLIHPHIAWIWEIGEEKGFFFLVERFVNGPALDKILSESGTLPWEHLHPILNQVAQGLVFAHDKGWVHGEVTPKNILISPDLGAVITDFGLRRALDASLPRSKYLFSSSSKSYIAPEVLNNEQPSPKSDQYSLARVAVESLIGQAIPDISSTSAPDATSQNVEGSPISWPVYVPWQVSIALERALSQDPSARFPTVVDFIESPEAISDRDKQTLETRSQWEAETQARMEAEEQSRLQAEERIRLAALEQARREIHEEIHQIDQERSVVSDQVARFELQEQPSATQSSRLEIRENQTRRRWLFMAFMGILVIVLIGLGAIYLSSRNGSIYHTETPTFAQILPTFSFTDTSAPTTALPPSLTPTITPTSTITMTPRPSQTQPPTPSSTQTPLSFRPQLRERTPPDLAPGH